ncbi:MAG TPA: aminotransferase class V-fold PLP-dependent enzyme [Gemmataceae bacterium]|nr:aminotransferase class V-fold PLP-dependent enzyme [Gemmataceae bacterium]
MDWTALRSEFPVTRRWAFFDHAAVAPISGRAQQALVDWAADMAENGDVHETQWVQRIETVRRLAGQLLHADALDIAFIKNTSEGIGIVAEGLPWKPGDNIITAAEEYPSNIYPWMNLASRGVEVRLLASRDRRLCVDAVRELMDSRTRLVSLSLVEYASGFRNDLDAIGTLCRERSCYFFVDAIQGLGVLPLDVERTPIDFLSADGHKWLLGPEGAGIFYIRRDLVDQLHPVGVGWNSVVGCRDFSRLDFRLKPHAGRWESGTLNVGGITALGASLELLLGLGISALAERVLALTDYLCAGAERVGFEVYSSRRPEDKSGIVSLIVPDADVRALVRNCRQQGIVINQRAGRIRISPHAYNTVDEIDRLLEVLTVQLGSSSVGIASKTPRT